MIEFSWEDKNVKPLVLLIELKWKAPLSGEDQLQRQWQEFLSEQERKNALHLFIAPETSAGAAARDDRVWQGRLVLLPWMEIKTTLKKLMTEGSSLARWAGLVNEFLEKIGIQGFNGFSRLALSQESQDSLSRHVSSPLFWRG
jgi:hypothetical protein